MSRLGRWSRLKRGEVIDETTEAEDLEAQAAPVSPLAEPDTTRPDDDRQGPAASGHAPAPGSLDETLPDPDTLAPGSDIRAFMAPGVSAGLRRRALRRLFAATHYNLRDGLDDYDDDYRQRLMPLADEVAQRLRRWAEPGEEPRPEDAPRTGPNDAHREASPDPDSAAVHSPAQEDAVDEPPSMTNPEPNAEHRGGQD